ncbi:hypothetical protein BpHYR1_025465 [Brachionus plicatilis]|uniref:Uncharacterized protein n=1 Tax=Brachionus plicatilis TaxID=10195 RepID=A0A3M7RSK0_BRAPC|nr:hypothetical protein BpHYR1_025465 [Brachionus plicatilis]
MGLGWGERVYLDGTSLLLSNANDMFLVFLRKREKEMNEILICTLAHGPTDSANACSLCCLHTKLKSKF